MPLLEIRSLVTIIPTSRGIVHAVNGASLTLDRGETVALVGESGSGKSMTARSVMGLIPKPGCIESGSIRFEGVELTELSVDQLRKLRGNRIAMVFQEPMTSLNPVLQIGDQLTEPLLLHRGMSKVDAENQAADLLRQVGISSPESRLREYPHQLSGGMRQRVMIAMALACAPELLIADEPTTALDVTIQAQILSIIDRLKVENGLALLLITHDLGIVAERADRVHVMYAGRIVESATSSELFKNPQHPYTKGLLASLPENAVRGAALAAIPGQPPDMHSVITGCPFRERCTEAFDPCSSAMPDATVISSSHTVCCWRRT